MKNVTMCYYYENPNLLPEWFMKGTWKSDLVVCHTSNSTHLLQMLESANLLYKRVVICCCSTQVTKLRLFSTSFTSYLLPQNVVTAVTTQLISLYSLISPSVTQLITYKRATSFSHFMCDQLCYWRWYWRVNTDMRHMKDELLIDYNLLQLHCTILHP